MKYGRFEIRNVKHSAARSYETQHFTLDLWADGKKLAEVVSHGDDSALEVYSCPPSSSDDISKYEAIMASDSFLTDTMICPFDTAVRTLVDVWRRHGEIRRKCSAAVVFIDEDRVQIAGRLSCRFAPTDYEIGKVLRSRPSAVILNGMDPVEAAVLAVTADRAAQEKLDAEDDVAPGPSVRGM